jgi:Putative MetA-pathway of phenol degradation
LAAWAQENYEIQVYPSETVQPGATMVELHSNFTFSGSKEVIDGVNPTQHQWHETIEITHGFNEWFETGFYLFTAASVRDGYQYAGSHIRPRFRIPPSWNWPVGISVSQEIGWVRPNFSADTWTYELRPIIDKEIGKWYLAFNPTIDKSFRGPGKDIGWVFSPNVKVGYQFTKQINGGLEYYGSLGPIGSFDPIREQQQQIIPAIDLDVSPRWEVNFGLGVGITGATDHLLFKTIVGYRFGKSKAGTN